jgi:hypothetical protein
VVSTGTFTNTEEYDGSAWTAGGSLNTARNAIQEQEFKLQV